MIRVGVDLGGTKIEAVALGPVNTVLAAHPTAHPARRLRRDPSHHC